MSMLDITRKMLNYELNGPHSLEDLKRAVWKWWNAYKAWEGEDTFLGALKDNRLCMSQRTYNLYDVEALRSPSGSKITYAGYKYGTSPESVAQRMNPANFEDAKGVGLRLKDKLGLLDLSGTLLNPKYKTLRGQLRWPFLSQDDADKKPVIFMPLPKPEDVAVYHRLRMFAKNKDAALRPVVSHIRHRLTRVIVADDKDLGAGVYDVAPTGSSAKLKYGWKSTDGVLSDVTSRQLETAATNYQAILGGARDILTRGNDKVVSSNEITIAVRHHNGEKFPIITSFDFKTDAWVLTAGSGFFPQGYLPDNWQHTLELKLTGVGKVGPVQGVPISASG
jgi:hypothetical protein